MKDLNWDIKHIFDSHTGIKDEEVMTKAIEEERIVITFDRDYGELVYKYGFKPKGVIYLRLHNFNPDYPAHLLNQLITKDKFVVEDRFTVIDEYQIRQRLM